MDAITEHHYHNIANGKAYENEDGKLSTVKTIIVEIDGVETLIPTVWDGKIVDDQTAIRFALDSGIDWPKRSGKEAVKRLEAFDKEIHLQFSDQTTPEEAQEILQVEEEESFWDKFNPLTGSYRKNKPLSVKAAEVVAENAPITGSAYTAADISDELDKEDPSKLKIAGLMAAEILGNVPLAGDVVQTMVKKGLRDFKSKSENVSTDFINDIIPKGNPPRYDVGKLDTTSAGINARDFPGMYDEFLETGNPTLKESINNEGIKEPLMIFVGRKNGDMILGEGNHRLKAATELGIEEVPVVVYVIDDIGFTDGEIPAKINTKGLKSGKTYSLSEFNLEERLIEGKKPSGQGSFQYYHPDGTLNDKPHPSTFTDMRPEFVNSNSLAKKTSDMKDEKSPTFALGGLATARKGITTEEGLDMADKKFQLDRKKADTDGDGKLSKYEEAKGEAIQKAMDDDELPEMAHGGMACSCGSGEECGCGTGMMSEPLPIGTTEAEVADDISVMISEGEYVLPANVVKWHGLKHIMSMQDEAEMGLMMMHSEGLIQEVNNETGEESDSEGVEDAEVSDEGDSEQEEAEEVIETPEGNEIEVAGIDTVITEPEFDETEDYENSDYGKPTSLGTMKRAKYSIIV